MKIQNNIHTLVSTAMLSAVAYLLAFIEIQLPLSPSFAKMDLSDLPALIAAFAFGPLSGVLVELIKNGLQLLTTTTMGIGELANFLMGSALALLAGSVYKRKKTRKTAMALTAGIMNYFVLLPLYENFMPLDQMIASFAMFIPFIRTKFDVVLWNAIPFSLLKGFILSLVTMAIYKPLTPLLKGRYQHESCKVSSVSPK